MPAAEGTDNSLPLPRILCLHGGGVNSVIFKMQFRSFLAHARLKNRFRFVFAEAPFVCDEAIGVHPVYSDYGPFRRWFRWLTTHPVVDDALAVKLVTDSVNEAMLSDPGTGEWVGVIGFSQGAKLAATLLYEQQLQGHDGPFKFGVIMAGRAPLVSMSDTSAGLEWNQTAGGLPDDIDLDSISERPEMRLKVPTVHVHGLQDDGLDLHRKLAVNYCAPGTVWLVELDINHRLPIKKGDVDQVVDAILEVVDEYGI